jgi:hypothetical protein
MQRFCKQKNKAARKFSRGKELRQWIIAYANPQAVFYTAGGGGELKLFR